MPDRLGPELDLLLAAEMKNRLEGVLEPVPPAARHAVVGLAPAEFIDEPPAPLPLVGDDEVLHVQVPLAIGRMLLDVEQVGAIRRQDRLDVGGDIAKPPGVILRRDRLEATRGIVLALRGIGRRGHHQVDLGFAKQR